jgi:methionine-rich copper-binding protein CopC
LLVATSAQAHAQYKESTPAKGEVLSASPSQVSITFTQDVQKVTGTYELAVTHATGSVTFGAPELSDADRSLLSVPLRPDLPPGRYEVHWRNLSDADGDPAEGAFSFYVGVQPTAADLAADDALALIGQEETPGPTADRPTPAEGRTPSASATAAAPSPDDGSDGNSSAFIILGVIIVAGAIAGFGGARWFMRRRA